MTIPADYESRVYAGWLGKCIGVRFGAPLEGWTYEEIRDHLGELTSYVREDRDKIFKPDDDTSVPMLQIRVLEDHGYPTALTAQQCGDTMLNYIADGHGTLWWGGYGISSEETAYTNLKNGIPAPQSGSIAMNGTTMAEQIGGQIFVDIWGLIAPNDPERAADMSEASSSVSHDGNGVYGGRYIASLVALAFSETDVRRLVERGLDHIPENSEFTRVVRAMLDFHAHTPDDWHSAFAYLKENFGYHLYPGMVHIIPNAGVVVLGLLYGNGDFSRTIQITNMAGWDTDCNVGNVGAILGVMVGVEGIDAHWIEPNNDLVITASLIGTRNILTITQCADILAQAGYKLNGQALPKKPRYHFEYAGATGNFLADGERGRPIHLSQTIVDDTPTLKVSIRKLNKKGEIRIYTRTSYRPSELISNYYGAMFTPLIFPGQTVTATLYVPSDAPQDLKAGLFVYDDNHDAYHYAEGAPLTPGTWHTLRYDIPELTDACLSQVGIALRNVGADWVVGSVAIRDLDWRGVPTFDTTFAREREESGAISQWTYLRGHWRLEDGGYHGSGPGINETYTGDIDWADYVMSAQVSPVVGEHHLINARVQGALRSYAFGLTPDNTITLYKNEGQYRVLASTEFEWQHGETYTLSLQVEGNKITASVQGRQKTLEFHDEDKPYLTGQIGFSTWHGSHTGYKALKVSGVRSS